MALRYFAPDDALTALFSDEHTLAFWVERIGSERPLTEEELWELAFDLQRAIDDIHRAIKPKDTPPRHHEKLK